MSDVFETKTADVPPEEGKTQEPSVADQIKSALADLVGEDKKFKNVEQLAEGKQHADRFIEQLLEERREDQRRIRELEEESRQAATKKELDELRKRAVDKPSIEEPKENTTPSLAEDDIKALINKHLTDRETRATAEENIGKTNEALVELFGDRDKAAEQVAKRASELGVSVADIKSIAAKSPTAAIAMFGGGGHSTAKTSVAKTSSVDSMSLGTSTPESVKAEFDKLRREDPNKYWSPQIQSKLFELKKAGQI